MKKVLLIAVACVAMTSCKKDYTCECTVTTAGISATASTTIRETKSKATTACEAGNSTTTVGGLSSTSTCKIK